MIEETEKFNKFFKFVYNNSIKIKFFKIILNIKINNRKKFSESRKEENKEKIREAVKRYFKEIVQLRKFCQLNFSAIHSILKKFKKITNEINCYDINMV